VARAVTNAGSAPRPAFLKFNENRHVSAAISASAKKMAHPCTRGDGDRRGGGARRDSRRRGDHIPAPPAFPCAASFEPFPPAGFRASGGLLGPSFIATPPASRNYLANGVSSGRLIVSTVVSHPKAELRHLDAVTKPSPPMPACRLHGRAGRPPSASAQTQRRTSAD